MNFKSGFVVIVGRPNVGKSTLLNTLVGQKIAITSEKPQTTRNKIQGILTENDFQIVFLDTPGIHKPKHLLGQYMVKSARNAMEEVDVVLFVVDGQAGIGRGDMYIVESMKNLETPVYLLINKIDAISQEKIRNLRDQASTLGSFNGILEISAVSGQNTDKLVETLVKLLPTGPKYYPDDYVTDHPESFIIAESIREKVLNLTREEIPHSIVVSIENISARKDKNIIDVHAVIFVERESQKGIVIGKKGSVLKKVGTLARAEMEKLLGSSVYLNLWVKVKKNWRQDEKALKNMGYIEQ